MSKRAVPGLISTEPCEPPVLTEAALSAGFSGDVSWVYAHPPGRETLLELLFPGPHEAEPDTTH